MPFKNISNTRPMGKAALRTVERQRQMANALQSQAMQPLGGKMAGRVYVADGPFKGAAKLAQMLAGTYGQNKADEREKQIEDDQRQAFATDVSRFEDARKGTLAVAEQGNPYEIFTGPQYSQGTPEVHATPPSGDPFSPDANPYQPATEYQPATQGGELIGGNTHVPAQAGIQGMSTEDASLKYLLGGTSEDAQKLGKLAFAESLKSKKDTKTDFQKTIEERDKHPVGSPLYKIYDDKIKKMTHIAPSDPRRFEPSYDKERGKFYGTKMGTIMTAARDSQMKMFKVNNILNLLKDVDGAGAFENIKLSIANFIKSSTGQDIDPNLGAKQAAVAHSKKLALSMRPEGSGVMTDADFNHFMDSIPGLLNTREGRELMANTMQKFAESHKELANMAAKYEREHGQIDANFDLLVLEHYKKNPIYIREEIDLFSSKNKPTNTPNKKQTYTAIPTQ
jgi:hypothetical protein